MVDSTPHFGQSSGLRSDSCTPNKYAGLVEGRRLYDSFRDLDATDGAEHANDTPRRRGRGEQKRSGDPTVRASSATATAASASSGARPPAPRSPKLRGATRVVAVGTNRTGPAKSRTPSPTNISVTKAKAGLQSRVTPSGKLSAISKDQAMVAEMREQKEATDRELRRWQEKYNMLDHRWKQTYEKDRSESASELDALRLRMASLERRIQDQSATNSVSSPNGVASSPGHLSEPDGHAEAAVANLRREGRDSDTNQAASLHESSSEALAAQSAPSTSDFQQLEAQVRLLRSELQSSRQAEANLLAVERLLAASANAAIPETLVPAPVNSPLVAPRDRLCEEPSCQSDRARDLALAWQREAEATTSVLASLRQTPLEEPFDVSLSGSFTDQVHLTPSGNARSVVSLSSPMDTRSTSPPARGTSKTRSSPESSPMLTSRGIRPMTTPRGDEMGGSPQMTRSVSSGSRPVVRQTTVTRSGSFNPARSPPSSPTLGVRALRQVAQNSSKSSHHVREGASLLTSVSKSSVSAPHWRMEASAAPQTFTSTFVRNRNLRDASESLKIK